MQKKLVIVENKCDLEKQCRATFDLDKNAFLKLEVFFEECNEYAEVPNVSKDLPDTGKIVCILTKRLTLSVFSSYPSNYLPMATDILNTLPNLKQGLTDEKAAVST